VKRAANTDRNHPEIVNAFQGRGCSVQTLGQVGDGCPDLLVGVAGMNLLVEVKSYPAGTVKGDLSEDQAAWHSAWRGQACVVRSLEDVGRLVQSVRALREVEQEAG
jgi:Holliday junction resolvase